MTMIPYEAYAVYHVHCPLTVFVNYVVFDEEEEEEEVLQMLQPMPGYHCMLHPICFN